MNYQLLSGSMKVDRSSREPESLHNHSSSRYDLVAVLVGALLPLLHALAGGATISDDWFLSSQQGADWATGIDRWFRPVQWSIHIVQYSLLGTRAWAHAIVMAFFGALFALTLRRTLVRVVNAETALLATCLWAVYPSSSTVHYWSATVPILVSMILVVLAWNQAIRNQPGLGLMTAAATLSILTYEAGMVLAVMAILIGLLRARASLLLAVSHLVTFTVVVLWNLVTSPKGLNPRLFASVDEIPLALLGPGLTPRAFGPAWLVFAFLPLVPFVVWRVSGRLGYDLKVAIVGLILGLVGISLPAVVGFPLVPVGLLDRANAMAAPGVALFLAGLTQWARPRASAGRLMPAALVLMFAFVSIGISRDIRQTEVDMKVALTAAESMPPGTVIIVPIRSGYVSSEGPGSLRRLSEGMGLDVTDAYLGNWLDDVDEVGFEVNQTIVVSSDSTVRVTPGYSP